jgi:mRNA-degrading endonuclease YafQ of YafQ-DinJ toxin-antitoxin module
VSYKITRTDKYLKKLIGFLKKHPDLTNRYFKTIKLFENDPYHPSLRLHRLQGTLREYHSILISMNYRIILELIITDKEILLLNIGKHSDIY